MTEPRPVRPDAASARAVVAEGDALAGLLAAFAAAPGAAREQVRGAFGDSREEKVVARLDTVDVASLRDVTRERLRLGALADAGVRTVGEVARLGRDGLEKLPDVGPQTATHLLAAAEQVARAVRESLRFRIDLTPTDPVATALVQALHTLDQADAALARYGDQARAALAAHERVHHDARVAASGPRRLLAWGERRRRAFAAVATLAGVAEQARETGLVEEARRVTALLAEPARPYDAWADFRRRSAAYYALLDGVAPTGRDVAAAAGHLPAELVDRVQTQALDESLLRVSLRGYQAFGARFALAQRRVVLGDEMGLGKTVQAIAVIAHLLARGATHALVVCPASVLENWVRELRAHADLPVHAVHGEERDGAAEAWRATGGVAVVTFAGLRRAGTDAFATAGSVGPAVLVVDEAHYVKNPLAKRSVAVAALADRSPHVLLLTGTPMENRVAEFRTLLGYLQPELAGSLDAAHGAAGPDAFRHAVAPAYLRRNAEDVLEELPELVQVDEWERLGAVDGAAYREAVAAGSFMAMRRAAFAVEHPEDSAKLRRLVELAREAEENGRKVVVFSYFRDVVDVVVRALGDLALAPLTGSVPARTRQTIVDDFTAAAAPRVLVSQIDVGGVGLNLQAASVVILCEPQTKPTTEAQAVARAHRMGQVETVQVHRLLTVDSVDEHLVRLLGTKARLFDAYARRSALAEEVAGAVDVSEASLARAVVDAERARLFVDPAVTSVEDAPAVDAVGEDEPVER
ncbi:superfamily II DNA or RNA helicase [Cellulosimicrobium cellulans]|uniref:DEAD/DEAH box helicase n=1 Tax=Cellulosimicrobium cellulans TaxID=1710 RepID=UPI00195BED34|nr:DEAD/DEAH box helicase [Cellulosimicrobium cellulans]MBM7819750.1 superfamily II DNA or RNA helicase [Cellulosimicrobium cellulans]